MVLLGSSPAEGAFGVPPLDASYELRPSRHVAFAAPAVPLAEGFENGWLCTGYTLLPPGDTGVVELYTYWRVGLDYAPPPPRPVEALAGTPLPLKLFSHLLGPDGSVLAGDDLAEVHARDEETARRAAEQVLHAYAIGDEAPPERGVLLDVIDG